MNRLKLIFPTLEMESQALAFRQECFDNGETEIQGDGGLDHAESYAGWIAKINDDLMNDGNPYVPASLYFAFDGDKLVGVIQIRHRLNEELLKCNGNIGYHIRPTQRKKGYATEMLALALEKCRELGLEKVLVSCDNDNYGSAKTIQKNGGVLENEVTLEDGAVVQSYWIEIPKKDGIIKGRLKLVFPTLQMEQKALDYRQECFDAGEVEINGDAGLDHADNYADWIKRIESDLTIKYETNALVPATEYFAFDGDRMIGTIQIRHKLNEYLFNYAGHIGYEIRPSERRKGYAAEMLSLALQKCRELGLERVLITCVKTNIGSAKTMIKNGGVLENEVLKDGVSFQRYWIELPKADIRLITSQQFDACIKVINTSFLTVAKQFGLTKETVPTHCAFFGVDRLESESAHGDEMYGLYKADQIIGFVSLANRPLNENDPIERVFTMRHLAVLPEYRHMGYGKLLIDYICARTKVLGGKRLLIRIIDEHTVLKNWYLEYGFIQTETRTFNHLPFTVCFMEKTD